MHQQQGPITLSFAIALNKSQGQTFKEIGLFIHKPLFSHGQFNVALSRCMSPTGIKIQDKFKDNLMKLQICLKKI